MEKIEQVYLAVLKYGFENADKGIRYIDLIEYLNTDGITFSTRQNITEYDTSILNLFISSFQTKDGSKISNIEQTRHGEVFYLKPESLSYLLGYESFQLAKEDSASARKEAVQALTAAKKAYWLAIASFIISSILAIISWIF